MYSLTVYDRNIIIDSLITTSAKNAVRFYFDYVVNYDVTIFKDDEHIATQQLIGYATDNEPTFNQLVKLSHELQTIRLRKLLIEGELSLLYEEM